MRDVILIDDDRLYMKAARIRLREIAHVHPCEPKNPVASGFALATKHIGALVLIDLELRDVHGGSSSAALYTVDELLGKGVGPNAMCVCSHDLADELTPDVKEELSRRGIQHVNKDQIVEWVKSRTSEKPPTRSRSRDQLWATNDQEVRQKYPEQLVAVYDCHVWGSGQTVDACLDEALGRPGAPGQDEFVLVRIPPAPDENAWFPVIGKTAANPTSDAR